MSLAYVAKRKGDYKSLKLVKEELREIRENEVRIKQHYIGINHMDVHHRDGTYPQEKYPTPLGISGAGEIIKIGSKVKDFKVGEKVLYGTHFLGSYAEEVNIDANYVVSDNELRLDVALSSLVPGLLAHSLIYRAYKLRDKDIALVHGATGNVGHILCQWLRHLNVHVIGTVGHKKKFAMAKGFGCTDVLDHTSEHYAKSVMSLTDAKGVNVVYDCFGDKYFQKNCQTLTYFGILVNYGDITGVISKEFNPALLWSRALFFTKPNLSVYKGNRMELVLSAAEVFSKVKNNDIKPQFTTFDFKNIHKAHKAIEDRQVVGNIIVKL